MPLLWSPNIFFFSTRLETPRMMYKKSSSFAYKFVVNCQFFPNNLVRMCPKILKIWHDLSHKQCLSKYWHLSICLYKVSCLQSWTKYLIQTLVFAWNRALGEKFNFRSFLLVLGKISFWHEDWTLGYNSMKFGDFLDIS